MLRYQQNNKKIFKIHSIFGVTEIPKKKENSDGAILRMSANVDKKEKENTTQKEQKVQRKFKEGKLLKRFFFFFIF